MCQSSVLASPHHPHHALRPTAVADLHLVLPASAPAVLSDAVLTPDDGAPADAPAEAPQAPAGHTVRVVYSGLGEPQVHRPDCAEGLRLCELPDVGHEIVTVADPTALAAHVYADLIARVNNRDNERYGNRSGSRRIPSSPRIRSVSACL